MVSAQQVSDSIVHIDAATDITFDALQRISDEGIPEFEGLYAVLSTVMHATLSMAPNRDAADDLMAAALESAVKAANA